MSSDKSEDKSQKNNQNKTEDETLFSFATTVLNHWVWDGKHRSKSDAQTVFTLFMDNSINQWTSTLFSGTCVMVP